MRTRKVINYIAGIAIILGLISCQEDDIKADWIADNPVPTDPVETGTPGTLDLSHYVSVGNSLTAGFADGALYTDAQNQSFPALLAERFSIAGGGDFNQPDINSENGFNSAFSDVANGIIRGRTVLDLSDAAPVSTAGELPAAYTGDKSALNNFGVPGIVIGQLLTPLTGTPGSPIENGLYTRFASAPGTSTILGDAIATGPSFFSLWIGANDALGYAVSGGVPAAEGGVDITATGDFQAALQAVLTGLTGTGSEGVVLTVPPLITIPFFQAVTAGENGINLIPLDEATATAVNAGYNDAASGYNPGLSAALQLGIIDQAELDRRTISFSAGNNPPVIVDESLTDADISAAFMLAPGSVVLPKLRHLESTDLLPLTAATVLGTLADPNNPASVIGVGVALEDRFTLTSTEQAEVVTARATFNGVISAVVTGLNDAGADIAIVDVQPSFADALGLTEASATALALSPEAIAAADGESGIRVEGALLSPDFAPNGIFSSDGVHPNPRGYAIVANLVIDAINDRWGASIPRITVLDKRGVNFQP